MRIIPGKRNLHILLENPKPKEKRERQRERERGNIAYSQNSYTVKWQHNFWKTLTLCSLFRKRTAKIRKENSEPMSSLLDSPESKDQPLKQSSRFSTQYSGNKNKNLKNPVSQHSPLFPRTKQFQTLKTEMIYSD